MGLVSPNPIIYSGLAVAALTGVRFCAKPIFLQLGFGANGL
jgi:hypothetical protein